MNRYAITALVASVLLLSACGGGGGGENPPAACTNTANMTLFTDSTGSTLLSSITVTAQYNAIVPDVPVWVGYVSPTVGAILAGYPAGGVDPLNYGIDIVQVGANTDNPLQFNATFKTNRSPATYHAVLRFVAANQSFTAPVDCQDVQVTFTVN